ncbi:tudor domain-containing protein 1-like [Pomacea canaliculata]|uniref:tudor domain-containing protein 1-like n=1 Tax=Pomacea canaliculata TaxID=400727 RepID=UPI000D733E1C|nr:tudor domain-containing protein 1-like [Pomacea canaliculata]
MLRQKTYTDRTLGPGSIEDVYVTFVKDPHNFFVQLESSADTLEKVSNQLQEYYKSKDGGVLTSWDLQAPCVALYSNTSWYGCQITGHPVENVLEVQFVDFGNTDFVSVENVRCLPPNLLSEPKLSFHCELQGMAPLQNFWSPEHIAQFEDLVLDKSVTTVLKSYNASTNTYMVQLMGENDENLNHQFCLLAELEMSCSETGGGNKLGSSRSVQASGDKDLQVTIRAGSFPKPTCGIAKSLGVEADGHVATSPRPLQHVRLNVGEKVEFTVMFVKSPVEF